MSSGPPREEGTHDPLSRRALAAWRTVWSTTGRGRPGLNILHSAILFCILLLGSRTSLAAEPETKLAPRIAAIVTTYYHNSHADLLVGRLLETSTLDGQGERPRMQLVSLYTDQIDARDKSRALAAQHGFKIYESIAGALTLGGDALAVDGVLLVAEHGNYPESASRNSRPANVSILHFWTYNTRPRPNGGNRKPLRRIDRWMLSNQCLAAMPMLLQRNRLAFMGAAAGSSSSVRRSVVLTAGQASSDTHFGVRSNVDWKLKEIHSLALLRFGLVSTTCKFSLTLRSTL